mmetsp:Transcript_31616/g.83518  ORF Transcript_31616/g.83518 Transcript_31616/m.83518 type:complete len:258 (+) Transcript_31616:594-1367(+)
MLDNTLPYRYGVGRPGHRCRRRWASHLLLFKYNATVLGGNAVFPRTQHFCDVRTSESLCNPRSEAHRNFGCALRFAATLQGAWVGSTVVESTIQARTRGAAPELAGPIAPEFSSCGTCLHFATQRDDELWAVCPQQGWLFVRLAKLTKTDLDDLKPIHQKQLVFDLLLIEKAYVPALRLLVLGHRIFDHKFRVLCQHHIQIPGDRQLHAVSLHRRIRGTSDVVKISKMTCLGALPGKRDAWRRDPDERGQAQVLSVR